LALNKSVSKYTGEDIFVFDVPSIKTCIVSTALINYMFYERKNNFIAIGHLRSFHMPCPFLSCSNYNSEPSFGTITFFMIMTMMR